MKSNKKNTLSFVKLLLARRSFWLCGVTVIILLLIGLGLYVYNLVAIHPLVPLGNDPVTHLEIIDHLRQYPWQTITQVSYPIGFHLMILLVSLVTKIQPTTILTYGAPAFWLLPILAVTYASNKWFGKTTCLLATSLAVLVGLPLQLSLGAYPDILAGQILVILALAKITNWLNERQETKFLPSAALIVGLILTIISQIHYIALLEILSLLFVFLVVDARLRRQWRILLGSLALPALFILLVAKVNPYLTPWGFFANLKAASNVAPLRLDAVWFHNISLNPWSQLVASYKSVGALIGFHLMILLYLSLVILVIASFTSFRHRILQSKAYLALGLITITSLLAIEIPWFPFPGRLLETLAPIYVIFVCQTFIIMWSKKFVGLVSVFAFVIVVVTLGPELNPLNLPQYFENKVNGDTVAQKSLALYLDKQYPSGAEIIAPVIKMYLPFFLPPSFTVTGPTRWVDITSQDQESRQMWGVVEHQFYRLSQTEQSQILQAYQVVIFNAYTGFSGSSTMAEVTSQLQTDLAKDPACSPQMFHITKLFVGKQTIYVVCERNEVSS